MVLEVNNLVFWNCIHLETTSNPFCLLINTHWLLVFALCNFFLIFPGFNLLFCWKGNKFSRNNNHIFLLIHIGLIFSLFYLFRDLLRELHKNLGILLINSFLVFLLFLVSEGLLFVSFFWTAFHSLSVLTL